MSTHATIKDALLALPVGPDAIAEHLAALNVKGICGHVGRCAVAVYLAGSVSDLGGLSVSRIDVLEMVGDDDKLTTYAELGREDIGAFVVAFDDNFYPELVAEPALAAA